MKPESLPNVDDSLVSVVIQYAQHAERCRLCKSLLVAPTFIESARCSLGLEMVEEVMCLEASITLRELDDAVHLLGPELRSLCGILATSYTAHAGAFTYDSDAMSCPICLRVWAIKWALLPLINHTNPK